MRGRKLLATFRVEKAGFRGDDDLRANVAKGPAEQAFAVTVAVKGGGVVESPAAVKGAAQRGDRVAVVGRAVGDRAVARAADAPGAETDLGDDRLRAAEESVVHVRNAPRA